jgi:hypothetical protein
MGRRKDENGLTPQQEKFCQYVVDAYGTNPEMTYTKAYRMAYNCKSDAQAETHWKNAHELMKNPNVIRRVKQLREEQARLVTISKEEMIAKNVRRSQVDPMDFFIEDEETHRLRMRKMSEMPKGLRDLLVMRISNGKIIWVLDKEAAEKAIIELLGFASAKDINIKTNSFGELMFGFDDEEYEGEEED